jgi:hypothetical protein
VIPKGIVNDADHGPPRLYAAMEMQKLGLLREKFVVPSTGSITHRTWDSPPSAPASSDVNAWSGNAAWSRLRMIFSEAMSASVTTYGSP